MIELFDGSPFRADEDSPQLWHLLDFISLNFILGWKVTLAAVGVEDGLIEEQRGPRARRRVFPQSINTAVIGTFSGCRLRFSAVTGADNYVQDHLAPDRLLYLFV